MCGCSLFACSAAIKKVTIVSFSLPSPLQRPGMIDAQKVLHSCSISSFTASTIKTAFNRLSNPNFPLSQRGPVQSHQLDTEAKRLLLRPLWHQVSNTPTDYMEGQIIDHCGVATHWTGMCSLLPMTDSTWQ